MRISCRRHVDIYTRKGLVSCGQAGGGQKPDWFSCGRHKWMPPNIYTNKLLPTLTNLLVRCRSVNLISCCNLEAIVTSLVVWRELVAALMHHSCWTLCSWPFVHRIPLKSNHPWSINIMRHAKVTGAFFYFLRMHIWIKSARWRKHI